MLPPVIPALLAAIFAQEPEAVIRTEVRQVLVPAIVTDAKGHHATGLRATDFTILEDGIRQTITSFSTDTDPALAAAPAAHHRTYVICFDTLHSSFANFGRAREALEKLFQKDQGDNAQVVMVGLGCQLRLIQTATSDRKLLAARLREKAFLDTLRGVDSEAVANEVNNTRIRMEQYCRRCQCGVQAQGSACNPERQDLRQQLNAQAARTALLGRAFLEGLRSLTTELGNLPGGRTLILVSDGFSLTPGAELFAVAAAFLPNYSEFALAGDTLAPQLEEALAVAVSRDIRVYAIDTRGLSSASFSAGGISDASRSGAGNSGVGNRGGSTLGELERRQDSIAFQNGGGLAHIAAMTGGVYFHNTNDLLGDFRSVLADAREYYLLSYAPTRANDDGLYRKIEVRLTNSALRVRAKEGYWAGK